MLVITSQEKEGMAADPGDTGRTRALQAVLPCLAEQRRAIPCTPQIPTAPTEEDNLCEEEVILQLKCSCEELRLRWFHCKI